MSNFQTALSFVLSQEGGYSNHPNDSGGATAQGVTQLTYNNYRAKQKQAKQSVQYITKAEVEAIYYRNYWLVAGCQEMPYKIALCVLDWQVNSGKGVALLQTVLGCKAVDNVIGKSSLNDLKYYLTKHTERELVGAYMKARRSLYKSFAKRPGQDVFLKGWLNRCDHLETVLFN